MYLIFLKREYEGFIMKSNNPFYSLAHTYISPTLQKQTIIGLTYYFWELSSKSTKKMYFTLLSFQFWVVLTSSHLGRVYHSKFKMVLPFIHLSIVSYLQIAIGKLDANLILYFFAGKILPHA